MMRAFVLAMAGITIGLAAWLSSGMADTKPTPSRPKKAAAVKTAPAEKKSEAVQKKTVKTPATPQKTETVIFAAGCFWCTELAFEQLEGVLDVESGYCGGTKLTANYDAVRLGATAHAEAIRITYDPAKLTYGELLDVFFDSHDPTQLNRQGNDEGRQYRSAIFFANDEQQEQAEAKIADLEEKRVYKRKIMTKLEPLKEFYPAEDYHQDFARRNPVHPYIQGHSIPKAFRVREKHPELIRKE